MSHCQVGREPVIKSCTLHSCTQSSRRSLQRIFDPPPFPSPSSQVRLARCWAPLGAYAATGRLMLLAATPTGSDGAGGIGLSLEAFAAIMAPILGSRPLNLRQIRNQDASSMPQADRTANKALSA